MLRPEAIYPLCIHTGVEWIAIIMRITNDCSKAAILTIGNILFEL